MVGTRGGIFVKYIYTGVTVEEGWWGQGEGMLETGGGMGKIYIYWGDCGGGMGGDRDEGWVKYIYTGVTVECGGGMVGTGRRDG